MSFKSTIGSFIGGRVRDSVFALQIFNIIRFAGYFIVSVMLVKIPLAVNQIATYEYVLFLSSIVTGWWIHGFMQSFMADSGHDAKHGAGRIFRQYSRLFVILGGGILLLVTGGIEALTAMGFLKTPPAGFYFFLMFHFVLQAVILMVYYFHQNNWRVLIYLFAGYFLMVYVGSFFLVWYYGSSLQNVYRCLAGLSIPVVMAWIYFYFKSVPKGDDLLVFRHFPHLTILMLIQGIGFLSLWSDGFWVQYFYGTQDMFALFRYGGREFPLFVILTTTFGTAMIHRGPSGQNLERIKKGSVRFIRSFTPIVIGLLITSQWLFSWVYSTEFIPASFVFDAYLLLILVRVLFPRPLLIASRKFKALLWVSMGELVINVVLSFTFYWIWGILGLILATLIAHLFEFSASLYLVRYRLKIRMERYIPLKMYLIFTGSVLLVFVLKYTLFSPIWLEELIR